MKRQRSVIPPSDNRAQVCYLYSYAQGLIFMGVEARGPMSWGQVKTIASGTFSACIRHDQLNNAAALSYYFLLSICPLLIFLVSLVALFPVPGLDVRIIDTVADIVPVDAMRALDRVLTSIFQTDRRLLSLGILGAIWAGSTGFNAMISALNSAYEVKDARPMWKTQLVALSLTVSVGAMLLISIFLSLLGSRFGLWFALRLGVGPELISAWPYIRWFVVVAFCAVSVELVYCLAPYLKQKISAQAPGAIFAVLLWLASSMGLDVYFNHFGQYTAVYGTLGATTALMMWFYFSSLAVLIGAEVNAQIQRNQT